MLKSKMRTNSSMNFSFCRRIKGQHVALCLAYSEKANPLIDGPVC